MLDRAPDGAQQRAEQSADAAADRLYRHHVEDARRLALILAGPNRAEELVAEAFARVLARMRADPEPIANFRAYLHVTIRNVFRESRRRPGELPVSDQPWLLDGVASSRPGLDAGDGVDAERARDAFDALPESWQRVLWYVEVEGRKPEEVGRIVGLRARAVSSLAHRAREGLRQAYLAEHLGEVPASPGCARVRPMLSRLVRGRVSGCAEAEVTAHLDGCPACRAECFALARVNERLGAHLHPVVLLGALPAAGPCAGWLGRAGGAGHSSAAAVTVGGTLAVVVSVVAAAGMLVAGPPDRTAEASAPTSYGAVAPAVLVPAARRTAGGAAGAAAVLNLVDGAVRRSG
ncbi:sigma-70 family RNA polymerase sigma factor [Nocardioides albidus]|uniref:Sigma-70 family RNA polymerase sigma factor n=1 Tax=Nocardioides albidus TaxID=1517589 RepID=A0A5C4VPE9_9ACTN|nr:sigma-70 family RNA polymerase sigma factor [Nocardioides albidus]TNM37395.1 sigma-70 family RNA polymerase sigma factor [Nocardioides albidus]